jgi:4-hydroxybenzoate polyprenyltransferase
MSNISREQSAAPAAISPKMFFYLLKSMRPKQWVKNVFVFAALAFSEGRLWQFWQAAPAGPGPEPLLRAVGAFLCFCMAASAIYLVNDLVDIEKDRAHPKKRSRPLPAGLLSPLVASLAAGLLIVAVVPLALLVDYDFARAQLDVSFLSVLITYIIIQGFLYTYWLKNVVILDILVLSAGFVLRAFGGSEVIDIQITPWLLVCMLLLAIFLSVGKRRHELILLEGGAGEHRRILAEYSVPMLDQMMSIVTAGIIMAYSMTTYSAPVAPQKPYPMLMITIPFVIYAIFRYLYLIYQRDGGGAPEELLLKDLPLAVSVVLWGITVLGVLMLFPN